MNTESGEIEEETEPTMKTAPTMATGGHPPRGIKMESSSSCDFICSEYM